MASKTDIANIAIAAHAGSFTQDIESEPGRTAEAIRALWVTTYELALAAHPWKWCKWTWRNQPALPADQNPDPTRAFAFRRPSDCVRVFHIAGSIDFDEWAGGIITCEEESPTFIGTQRDRDVGDQPASFNYYFGMLIAVQICTPINASEAIRTRCQKELAVALAEARNDNGKAGTIQRPFADSFVSGRVLGNRPSLV